MNRPAGMYTEDIMLHRKLIERNRLKQDVLRLCFSLSGKVTERNSASSDALAKTRFLTPKERNIRPRPSVESNQSDRKLDEMLELTDGL